MRSVSSYPIPDGLNYSNIPLELEQLLKGNVPDPNIYKGSISDIQSPVYHLRTKYKNKCGYCERACSAPQVEHHRPKGQVNNGTAVGTGYFWLAYEWTNLVASCKECNERPNKGTQFPLRGVFNNQIPLAGGNPHIPSFRYNSEYLELEEALLLHPEFCTDLETHLLFNRDGTIFSTTDEGNASITVYGLSRPDLNLWRKKEYERFKAVLNKIVKMFLEDELDPQVNFDLFDFIQELIIEANDDSLEYTLFRKAMFSNLDSFFIQQLDPQIQDRIKARFTLILESI